MKIISAKEVTKIFSSFTAVDKLSFELRKGECFGLLGPNGAGKSTFIGMLYGVNSISSGNLEVFEMNPKSQARKVKQRMGVVTQDNALDDSLTVIENMMIYASFLGVPKKEREKRIKDLLDFMNLSHKANAPIRFLSGGMKRRLVFVRSLLGDPELLVLDEPTTGLDPAVRHLLWGKVRDLKAKGKTILLTTHYMHEAEILCDRILVMNKGKSVAEGSPSELIQKYCPGYVAVYDQIEKNESVKKFGEKHNFLIQEDRSGIYLRAPKFEDLLKMQEETKTFAAQLRPANLEDVFLQLTGQELTADA
ncbi:MAG: ABC transporter ATP-binding protein [Oligoflexia bacterium]|nr:ABC transporter ATP-binding protein [Oligoflexia bacterium]